jgi:AraC-like DNA-binding protein
MKLYIKNMVCDRCKRAVSNILAELDFQPLSVLLGEVDMTEEDLDAARLHLIKERLEALGFELINSRKHRIIEKIKNLIIEIISKQNELDKIRLSDYLADRLHLDYNHLSQLFSQFEGVTIEHYFINQRIEKVKELLVYDELTLTEISIQLGYSSVAHLSNQFKKITGLTPSHFRKLKDAKKRLSLDKL